MILVVLLVKCMQNALERRSPPRLLLVDALIIGYTLITLLKDRMGSAMPAATLALTAYAGAADRKRALDAGFREHLAKPVNPSVLLQTLEDMLASTEAPSELQ